MASLQELPARVAGLEVQVLHLRTEMRDEFSAVRRDTATKRELDALGVDLRREIAALRDELREDIALLARGMTALFMETQRQMRVLHEDLAGRIAAIGDS